MTKTMLWPNVLAVLTAIVFGFPAIHAALHHPVSRMGSANPVYRELTQNAFMVMSSRVEPISGRLVRFGDSSGKLQISRVVGMPGDQIRFRDRTLSVNGKVIAGYPEAASKDESLNVPPESVFCFPDFIPAGAENPQIVLQQHVLPVSALTGSVLYVFDNATSGKENPELFVYGAVLLGLYAAVFFGLGARKVDFSKPVYRLARLSVGLNLAIWLLLSVYGLATGLTAIVPAIYYIFVSSLNFLGLSIAASATLLLAMALFVVVAVFSDRPITLRRGQAKF